MADTKHAHAAAAASIGPTEGDGVSYKGLVWFGVILVGTTLVCQVIVWGMFELFDKQATRDDVARAPLAAPVGAPAPPPNLLTDEPGNLATFRHQEDEILSSYGWVDKNSGVVRIPIERAKALLLEKGVPVRGTTPAPAKVKVGK